MADSQPQTTENAAVNSVVNDLMRVYENLTQSSTPQAGVPDDSKTLPIAYDTTGAPQTVTVPVYQPPPGYSIPPNVYQQQQEAVGKNALHAKSEPTAPPPAYSTNGTVMSYQQPPVGYTQVPMAMVTTVPSSDAQRSGEESHTLMRTSSMASKISQAMHSHHQPPADASSESDKSIGARSRRKRKPPKEVSVSAGGGGSKKGGRSKKSKKEDGRWSKRFTWPEGLHRDFVSAIFDVGLKHSSPSTIMEHMPKHEQITTERIKSHLQKYRLHRVKSKKEFISSYEASLQNFQQNGSSSTLVSGSGEVAAHLTASTLGANKINAGAAKDSPAATASNADANHRKQIQLHGSQNGTDGNDSLILPQLTEAEKASPIGAAMGYLMGLFFSLKQQLIIQRSLEAAGEKAKGNVIFAAATPSMGVPDAANVATSAATAAAVAAGVEYVAGESNMQQAQPQNGAARNTIEVNSMMKREMQNQMALQNKMRALKQQELDKYKGLAAEGNNPHLSNPSVPMETYTSGVDTSEQPQQAVQQPVATQGAGEMAGNDMNRGDGNNNLLGIENSEDFWQNDVMDDQLFEFLMNS